MGGAARPLLARGRRCPQNAGVGSTHPPHDDRRRGGVLPGRGVRRPDPARQLGLLPVARRPRHAPGAGAARPPLGEGDLLLRGLGRRAAAGAGAGGGGARPRDRLPQPPAPRAVPPDAGGVPPGPAARAGRHRGCRRAARAGLPRSHLVDPQGHAVGARRAGRGGLRLRLEHLPGPPRPLRAAGRSALRTRPPARRRPASAMRWPALTTASTS